MKLKSNSKKFGNNRGLQFYDASKNGMILSMRNGIGKL